MQTMQISNQGGVIATEAGVALVNVGVRNSAVVDMGRGWWICQRLKGDAVNVLLDHG